MATIKAFIRTTKKKTDDVNIRFRLSAGRGVQLFHTSEIMVTPDKWDAQREMIKSRALVPDSYRREINSSVTNRKRLLMDVYSTIKDNPTTERWNAGIDRKLNPSAQPKEKTFFDIFDEFVEIKSTRGVYLRALERCLRRWEMYRQTIDDKAFKIDINALTDDDIMDFNDFLRDEYQLQDDYLWIYEAVHETRRIEPRGNNTLSFYLQQFRTFYRWAKLTGRTTNNPFERYKVQPERYGTPFFLTIEELTRLLHTDMTAYPETATQRDIFVFQSLTGCRVGDLVKLSKINIKDGSFIEYIPKKTKGERPITVRVPLTETARELIRKYDGADKKGRLFPFASTPTYNKQIKKALILANLNRLVTVLNPATGEEMQRPLCEVASSHTARKSFIGNLYREIKDPNLISSMTGHADGSRVFARYRNVDDKMKIETIKILEI